MLVFKKLRFVLIYWPKYAKNLCCECVNSFMTPYKNDDITEYIKHICGDMVWIKCLVCHSSGTVMVVKQTRLYTSTVQIFFGSDFTICCLWFW